MRYTLTILIFFVLVAFSLNANEHEDSPRLSALFEADQAVRAQEAIEAGRAPSLQEERERRIAVMKLISEGETQTSNDFFHAGMILHHTSRQQTAEGHLNSLGAENHLMAFFLFRQAHKLGHHSGLPLMAAAYNYYLRACGEDAARFGYRFVDSKPIWRPDVGPDEVDALKCGFDPRPYIE